MKKKKDHIPSSEISQAPRVTATIGQKCRVCGCTNWDCRQCIKKTGEPCHWVEEDLCSACVASPGSERDN